MEILIKDKKHLLSAAKKLLEYFGDNKIIAFYGAMGAGKTTIIKALCELLGAVDIVSSPTFTLVNEYKTSEGETLYHIDFYRIKKQEEVFDFGIEEYLDGNSYCFMEWPELVEDILPAETLKVRIVVDENEQRILSIS
ncbi:MAG TPA: tRNA (adenosine(37)-N6)-threonylcarbamoyltransferase complex ATPase subunit type 1 TsaE [Bacteroidales bacterium]|nr:tRNA (adenosine(37)-N6)-threonylcarbamoyltransferase complex ATPase subunit type 1 TsaE [Bacteroidales bacterium]HPT20424.1 tRNA (adenosine(37)-N6)-threonylcarbamoyltransferase complex ATPase subunit type 1 TsaE [Bacteroidales bacterium]